MALTKVDKSLLETTSGTPSASTYLRGDGTWAAVDAGGGLLGYVVYTTGGTYTAGTSGHADVTAIVIEVQAGGGGGGAANSGSTATGAGGAGGAYARKGPIAVTTGQTATITVGAKGDKGAYGSGSAGTAGGTSSAAPGSSSPISFTTITCTGGGGGAGNNGSGGTAGTVTSAAATYDIRIDGQDGSGTTSDKLGGGSALGIAGQRPTAGNGEDATGYGAGGCAGGGEATGGGDGSPGIVIIAEYKT